MISFDHWHLGYLGCYGNDWIETPHLDRLASQSVVFDRHFSENIDPAAANHAWWTGRWQFPLSAAAQRTSPSWCDQLHDIGVKTHLVSENDGREDIAIAPAFDSLSTARGTDGFDVAESETPFAQAVQKAEAWLTSESPQQRSALLWVKSRGIPSPWTPPRDFADLYLDEFGLASQNEDDSAAATSTRDTEINDSATDPEELQGESRAAGVDESLNWRYAAAMYAAYVTLVDRWFGKLLKQIDESPEWNQALLIVTAGGGQPLGEHGQLTDAEASVRAESIHAPLWIRLPVSDQGGTRRQAIVQTLDIGPTLLDWFGAPSPLPPATAPSSAFGASLLPLIRNDRNSVREAAWIGCGRLEWGLLTSDFLYVEAGDENQTEEPMVALFEKPHDRWDQFDVALQFRGVVEEFHETMKVIPPSSP